MFMKLKNKNLCEHILMDIAKQYKIMIVELMVMENHIHIIVSIPSTLSLSKELNLMKSGLSHELFKIKLNF